MTRILACADFHLGMKFAGYPSVQQQLSEARFSTLKRLVGTANQKRCDLFLVAGDLFDRVSVSARDVKRAAELLNAFQGRLVAVLPGNHDFYSGSPSTLWARFREAAGDRILLLEHPKIYDLNHYDLKIRLYAGPCDSKHSQENAVSWMKDLAEQGKNGTAESGTLRIGVAHGSIEGISPDAQGVYFPMRREELEGAPVNFWVVGHTHRQHPFENTEIAGAANGNPPVLIPGTPEPDGFDCRHGGTAWTGIVSDEGRLRFESLGTGTYRFVIDQQNVERVEDLRRLETRLKDTKSSVTLMRLKLSGRLESEQLAELRQVLARIEKNLLYLRLDDGALVERISEQNVEAEFTEGSFPYRLLKDLIAEEDFEALQTAYSLLQEQKL